MYGRAYPEIAVSHVASHVWRSGERSLRRESERFLVKFGVSARFPLLVEVLHECFVKAEQARPVIDKWHGGNVVRDDVVRNRRVIDHNRIDVVVGSVGGIVHGIGNVGDTKMYVR